MTDSKAVPATPLKRGETRTPGGGIRKPRPYTLDQWNKRVKDAVEADDDVTLTLARIASDVLKHGIAGTAEGKTLARAAEDLTTAGMSRGVSKASLSKLAAAYDALVAAKVAPTGALIRALVNLASNGSAVLRDETVKKIAEAPGAVLDIIAEASTPESITEAKRVREAKSAARKGDKSEATETADSEESALSESEARAAWLSALDGLAGSVPASLTRGERAHVAEILAAIGEAIEAAAEAEEAEEVAEAEAEAAAEEAAAEAEAATA